MDCGYLVGLFPLEPGAEQRAVENVRGFNSLSSSFPQALEQIGHLVVYLTVGLHDPPYLLDGMDDRGVIATPEKLSDAR